MSKNHEGDVGGRVKTRRNKGHDTEGKRQEAVKPKRAAKVRGVPADYSRGKTQTSRTDDFLCRNIGQLLDGLYDREVYEINGVEFAKEMHPKYKGALVDSLFIVATNVPVSHPLVLAGASSGTRISFDTLTSTEFKSGIKNKGMYHAVEQLYKFLRKAAEGNCIIDNLSQRQALHPNVYVDQYDQCALTATPSATEVVDDPVKEDSVETDPRIIWDGHLEKDGMGHSISRLIKVNDVTFRLTENQIGGGHSYPIVYIHRAPFETPLYELSGSNTFIRVAQLRATTFNTKLTKEESVSAQKRMWDFLHPVFVSNGYPNEEKAWKERKAEMAKAATPAPVNDKKKFSLVGDNDMSKLWNEASDNAAETMLAAINNVNASWASWKVGKTPEEGAVFQIVRRVREKEYSLYPIAIGRKCSLHGKIRERGYTSTFDGGKFPEKAEYGKTPTEKAILSFIFNEGRALIDAVFTCHKFLLAKIEDENRQATERIVSRAISVQVAKAAGEVLGQEVVVGAIAPDESHAGSHLIAPQLGLNLDKKKKAEPKPVSMQERVIQMTIDSRILQKLTMSALQPLWQL